MRYYLQIILVTFLLFSCSEDKSVKPSIKECRVDKVTDNTGTISYYTYNDKNQISIIKTDFYEKSYTYLGNNIAVRAVLDIGIVIYSVIYTLNTEGSAVNSIYSNVDDTLNGFKDSSYYFYSSEGYLLREDVKHYKVVNGETSLEETSTIFHKIQDGNRISTTEIRSEGERVTTYEYSELLTPPSFDDDPFLGKENKNLVKKVTFKDINKEPNIINYEYELNKEGYPFKITTITDEASVNTYEYTCQ